MQGTYFSLVGAAPLAVANSFSWFLKLNPTIELDKLFFIVSNTEAVKKDPAQKMIPEVLTAIEDNLKHFELFTAVSTNIQKQDLIVIPEANLPTASGVLFHEILKRKGNTRKIFLDVTGGRKTMTGAATIASLYLQDHFHSLDPAVTINLVYYWLKRYIRSNLKKPAYRLGRDEIEVKVFGVDFIQQSFEELNNLD